jgi:Uma2 family endonuclease
MVVPQEKLYTVDEFETFIARPEHADRLFELINGEIVEKMPTQRHGVVTVNISAELKNDV